MTGFQTVNVTEADIAAWLISATGWAAGNTTLLLFTNDPEAGLTAAQKKALTNASFTAATFTGYANKTLTAATWVVTAGLPTKAEYPAQTFTRTSTGAAQLVRGYWIRRNTDSRLLGYEYFPGPLSFEFNADTYTFTPRVTILDSDD
jgi:hypothetical protein